MESLYPAPQRKDSPVQIDDDDDDLDDEDDLFPPRDDPYSLLKDDRPLPRDMEQGSAQEQPIRDAERSQEQPMREAEQKSSAPYYNSPYWL